MAYADQPTMTPRKAVSIALVLLLHAVIGYAFVTGLAYQVIKKAAQDLKVVDIKDQPPPPEQKPTATAARAEVRAAANRRAAAGRAGADACSADDFDGAGTASGDPRIRAAGSTAAAAAGGLAGCRSQGQSRFVGELGRLSPGRAARRSSGYGRPGMAGQRAGQGRELQCHIFERLARPRRDGMPPGYPPWPLQPGERPGWQSDAGEPVAQVPLGAAARMILSRRPGRVGGKFATYLIEE